MSEYLSLHEMRARVALSPVHSVSSGKKGSFERRKWVPTRTQLELTKYILDGAGLQDADNLKWIQLYLCLHFSELIQATKDAEEIIMENYFVEGPEAAPTAYVFRRPFGLESTAAGQIALRLDTSGKLRRLGNANPTILSV